MLVSVAASRCRRLLTYRRSNLVAKADGLPTVCSEGGCGPHKCKSDVPVWNCRTTGLKENVAVWNCEVEEMKEQFLRPFPRTATDRVAVGYSVTFIDVTLVLIVIHNGWLQGFSTLVTKVTFCQLIMTIRQHVYVTFVLPEYRWLVTTCPDSNVIPFQSLCLSAEVAWHSSTVCSKCTAAVHFLLC